MTQPSEIVHPRSILWTLVLVGVVLTGCTGMKELPLIDTGQPALREHRVDEKGKIVDQGAEYWLKRCEAFREDNPSHAPGGIVLVGDSITEGFPVDRLFPGLHVVNRGISGDKIGGSRFYGVLDRVDVSIGDLKPAKVFLLIGVNDIIYWDVPPLEMRRGYESLLARIRQVYPDGPLYVQTLLPLRGQFAQHIPEVLQFNDFLRETAPKHGATLLDTYPAFLDAKGELKDEFTKDGLHLTDEGYARWREILLPLMQE